MRKAILSLLLVVASLLSLSGAPVSPSQAMKKAASFLSYRGTTPDLSLVRQGRQTAPSNQTQEKEACYYVFNQGDGQGFVIISGDDAAFDILGYTDQGCFDQSSIPENLQALLDDFSEEIIWARAQGSSTHAIPTTSPSAINEARQVVSPLLTCNWGQNEPYNHLCFTTSGVQAATGCVATALAQVMYYYKWPRTSTTEIPAYSSYDALPPITFDWASMLNSYNRADYVEDASNLAVATLMEYCGHAVGMKYGTNSSSASSSKIPNALSNYFGYGNHAKEVKRERYDIDGWNQLIYEELVAGRPVIYSAASSESKHAFVCDGFDGDGLFHINWGWGGLSNGYFRLQALNPSYYGTGGGSGGGFSNGQYAIIGISPQALEPASNDSGSGIATMALTLINSKAAALDEKTYTYDANTGLQPVRVKYQYYQTCLSSTYDLALGLFDNQGQMIDVLTVNTNYQGSTSTTSYNRLYLKQFGKNIEDGSYQIKGMDRVSGSEEWHLSKNSDKYYLQMEKNGDQATIKTIKNEVVANISLTQVSQNFENSTPTTKCIRVYVKNNGEEEFCSPLFLYLKDMQDADSLVTYETPYLASGSEDYIDYYLEKEAGTYPVVISLKSGPSNILFSNDTFTLTDESTIPLLTFVASEIKNIDGDEMYGSLIDGTITLANNTSEDYNHSLSLKLLKPAGGNKWWVFAESLPTSIPAGRTVTIPFQFPISVGETFRLIIFDNNETFATFTAKTVKAAFITWKADGERTATAPTTTLDVPADAAAVSFEELGDLATYDITINDNPNTLYYLPHDASVPDVLQDRNVVKSYEADDITLTDGYGFYVPKTFCASHASYTRRPSLVCNGQTGWQTILLPFSVQEVTSSGVALNPLHEASTSEGYWLKAFNGDIGSAISFTDADGWTANAPYLLGTSASCKNNDLVLSASNILLQKTPANIVKSKNYQFIGTTCDKTVTNAYVMNASGSAFIHNDSDTVEAFRAYFTARTPLAEAPSSLPLGHLLGDVNGDGTVNISDVTVLVNHILNFPGTLLITSNADINGDKAVNVTDVTGVVNIILGLGKNE